MTKELFRLECILDNPRFDGFSLSAFSLPSLLGRENFSQDLYPAFGATKTNCIWKQAPFAQVWKPLKLEEIVPPYQDYPCINWAHPAFSRRACDALRDLLEPNGELLPLETKQGEYYFYNITTVVDAIDHENAVFDSFSPPPCTDAWVKYFAFHENQLQGLSIFRILEVPTLVIVTDRFVQRVHEAGLNGFDFTKIWPFPKGVNWREAPLKAAKLKRKKDAELARNVLVIRLWLTGEKPSAAEKKRISKLEKELLAQLMLPSLQAPYFGTYEGSDTVDSEFRIFITCPDVDRLVHKLHPWLKSLQWDHATKILKRYGELRDVDAREETVEFD